MFRGDFVRNESRAYGFDRRTDRFLMKQDQSEPDPKELGIVVHWFDELKRLAPVPSRQ